MKCWSTVGVHFSQEGCEHNDDLLAGKELLTLEWLINQVQDTTNEGQLTLDEYINIQSVACFQPLIYVNALTPTQAKTGCDGTTDLLPLVTSSHFMINDVFPD